MIRYQPLGGGKTRVRPVSKARALRVTIVGEEEVQLSSLTPTPRGYMRARVDPPAGADAPPRASMGDDEGAVLAGARAPVPQASATAGSDDAAAGAEDPGDEGLGTIVCVVGLAHANGVLDRCAWTEM